jgi:hypothetical protein
MDTKFIFKYVRKLPGKWLIPVIAAIWVLGVGFHVMSTTTCIVLTAVIVGGWLLYLLLRWLLSKGKVEIGEEVSKIPELEEKLTSVTKTAKNVPWYLVVGPLDSGKTTLLRNSDLDFSYIDSSQDKPVEQGIEKTGKCDLFYTRQGILLDTTGRYVSLGKEAQVRTEWLGVLSLLKKYRRMRPIEGLIVAVDLPRLVQAQENVIREEARRIRERIVEAISNLEISFPVYLIFTKCDAVYGFTQFFDNLTGPERSQVWGATLGSSQQADPQAAFREECRALTQSLRTRRTAELASAEGRSGSTIYAFPSQFDAACESLEVFVEELFHIVSDEKPVFRGFYFTSSTQGGEPSIDFLLGDVAKSLNSQPPPIPEQRLGGKGETGSHFIRDMFQRVIFSDKGLDRPTTEAERRRTKINLAFCSVVLAVLLILAVVFVVSHIRNRSLMTDVKSEAIAVDGINSSTQPVVRLERFEKLREDILRLEGFTLFGLPWRGARYEVALAARKLYLSRRYGSTVGAQEKLGRRVEIPVKVFKSEAGDLIPIEKAEIRTIVNGKEYKTLKTNKDGTASLKMRIKDGRLNVDFSTDYELTGYEVQRKQTYQIQPGEQKSKDSIRFIFSKSGRVITVHCADQFGKDLPGVPVSIIEQIDESKKYGPAQSNEKGVAQLSVEAPENSVLLVYYGDSPANYQEAQPDSVTIQAGQTRYSLEKQLRRKLEISVIATAKSASGEQAKPGVSVSVGGTKLGLTDNNGYWTGAGDTVPTRQNVAADPRPNSTTVETTASGYSIKLEYVLREPTPVVDEKPDRVETPPPLPVIKLSESVPADIEVWMYLEAGDESLFNSTNEVDRMEFRSGGEQIRLVRLEAMAGEERSLKLPREAENHQLQLYHPDYWPQKASWEQAKQSIQMIDIKQERSLKDFGKVQIDGSDYYYEHAQIYHNEGNVTQAIRDYENAIRLAPRLRYYLTLAWAYYNSDQADAALRKAKTGMEFKLTDDPEADEQLLNQQLRELLSMLE